MVACVVWCLSSLKVACYSDAPRTPLACGGEGHGHLGLGLVVLAHVARSLLLLELEVASGRCPAPSRRPAASPPPASRSAGPQLRMRPWSSVWKKTIVFEEPKSCKFDFSVMDSGINGVGQGALFSLIRL